MVQLFDVIFVIHQIGSGADGGIRSISEIVRSVSGLHKAIITNSDAAIGRDWADHATVSQWAMSEGRYGHARTSIRHRLMRAAGRVINNFRMFLLVRSSGAKVVHCNDHRAFWNTALGASAAGAKVIFNVRDTMRADTRSRISWRTALRLCDLFLVLSPEMMEAWKRDLRPTSLRSRQARKFRYLYSIVDREIHYPVDASARSKIRARFGIAPDEQAVVYVGRFDDKKAQLDFIKCALPGLLNGRSRVSVYFVGDFDAEQNAYAALCKAEAARPGLTGRVHFIGYSGKTADWYRAADCVALASRREGLPRCVIEAIACGAPVASFDVCSVRGVLEEGGTGLVVTQGDHAGLAQAIRSLLDDPEMTRNFSARGPELARELFDADRSGRAYVQLVHDLGGRT